MKLSEKRCPKCDSALQAMRKGDEVLYACRCGHGEDHDRKTVSKGILHYQKILGARALTRVFGDPQTD